MKKCLVIFVACLLLLAGCANQSSSANSSKADGDIPTDVKTGAAESGATSAEGKTTIPDRSGEVVKIEEKMFIAQCNDIYLNPGDYAGKTVQIEGLYDEYVDEENGTVNRGVIRNGPGCCGNDGVAGFTFSCAGNPDFKKNDWISVEGILTPFAYEDGYETVIIEKANVTVKAQRGSEYVSQ